MARFVVIWGTERNMPIKSRPILTGMFITRLTSSIMLAISKRKMTQTEFFEWADYAFELHDKAENGKLELEEYCVLIKK